MAEMTIQFTPQQIDALQEAIEKTQQQGGTDVFCKNWDTVEPALQVLSGLLAAVPGVGVFAGPAIAVVVAAGNAAKRAVCP
jgi:hypothetical protein